MKKIMILGGSVEFVHIVERAHKKGITTVVVDGKENAPAKAVADIAYDVDCLDFDGVAEVAKKEKADGIITGYSDVLSERVVALNEHLGLPLNISSKDVKLVTNKLSMKKMLDEIEVPVCAYMTAKSPEEIKANQKLRYPLVLKPIDGWGSRGVYIVDSYEEVVANFEEVKSFSKLDQIMVEEYYKSQEVCILSYVKNNVPYVLYMCDKELWINRDNRLGKPKRLIYPSKYSYRFLPEITEYINRMVKASHIQDGPFYVQGFIGKEGFKVNEISSRLPGGNDFRFLPRFTDLDILNLYIDFSVGNEVDQELLDNFSPCFDQVNLIIQIMAKGDKKIKSIEGEKEVLAMEEVDECEFYVKPGDYINDTGDLRQTIGRIHAHIPNYFTMEEVTEQILNTVHIVDVDGTDVIVRR